MAATREDISCWFDRGVSEGATHMIVVCDTLDHEDYPVFVKPDQDCRKVYEEYNGRNMQRVMEVYSLRLDKETQLRERRVFHLD